MKLFTKVFKFLVFVVLFPSLLYANSIERSLFESSVWKGTPWRSSQGNLADNYYQYLDPSRNMKEMISGIIYTNSTLSSRTLDGVTTAAGSAYTDSRGLRGVGVVENIVPHPATFANWEISGAVTESNGIITIPVGAYIRTETFSTSNIVYSFYARITSFSGAGTGKLRFYDGTTATDITFTTVGDFGDTVTAVAYSSTRLYIRNDSASSISIGISGFQVTATPYAQPLNVSGSATVTEAGTNSIALASAPQLEACLGGEGSVVGDELVTGDNFNFDTVGDWTGEDCTLSVASNLLTVTYSAATQRTRLDISGLTVGAQYIISMYVRSDDSTANVTCGVAPATYGTVKELSTTWQKISNVITATSSTHTFGSFSLLTSGSYQIAAGVTIKPLTPSATLSCLWTPMFDAADLVGADQMPNGTFDDATGWTLGTGWSISSGVLNVSATGWSNATINIGSVSGKRYRVALDITRTSGELRIYIGNGQSASVTTSGTKIVDVICGSSPPAVFYFGSADFVGTIDNVVVTELKDDIIWQCGSGKLYYNADGNLRLTDGTNTATKSLTAVAETQYGIEKAIDGLNNRMKIGVFPVNQTTHKKSGVTVFGDDSAFSGSFSPGTSLVLLGGSHYQFLDDIFWKTHMEWFPDGDEILFGDEEVTFGGESVTW